MGCSCISCSSWSLVGAVWKCFRRCGWMDQKGRTGRLVGVRSSRAFDSFDCFQLPCIRPCLTFQTFSVVIGRPAAAQAHHVMVTLEHQLTTSFRAAATLKQPHQLQYKLSQGNSEFHLFLMNLAKSQTKASSLKKSRIQARKRVDLTYL